MQFMNLALIIERYLFFALGLAVVVLALWALVDCLRHGADRFIQEGKRTKGFWTGLNVAGVLVGLLSLLSINGSFLQLIAACVVCVYLADVKPAVSGKGGWYHY